MDQNERRQKRAAELQQREMEIRARIVVLAACGILAIILIARAVAARRSAANTEEETAREEALFSEGVLEYRDLVVQYAKEEGIEDHVPVLLAIMEVETKGTGSDVMQSSESKGLRAGTLGPEDSIAQACSYYAELLTVAEEHGCDEKSVIQAYNFGPGYLAFVGQNGGVHTQELATEFARERSGGETVAYTHDVAEDGWIYKYGNMYYEARVEEYLP